MNEALYIIIPLLAGFLLDTILGDPLWLPHPIRLFGNAISFCDKLFNKGRNRKLKGLIIAIILVTTVWSVLFVIIKLTYEYPIIYYPLATIMVFYGIANHNLISEGLKVENQLSDKGLEAGRKQLSYIVGRDTSKLLPNQIRIAILETLSENLSDGVIAPLFYYAIGGIPLMLAYKMVNTLDSMIGYKNEKYGLFGWFSAKLDDVANYIPARITAFLMVLITFNKRGLKYIFQYGNKHASPNAGYPEAALAGILNCRFGGPNIYHGKLLKKPYIGTNEREINRKEIVKTSYINFFSSVVCILLIVIIYISFF